MALEVQRFTGVEDLRRHLSSRRPTLYFAAQTSTVTPFAQLDRLLAKDSVVLGDLSGMPTEIQLQGEEQLLKVAGAVSWKEARQFLRSHGRTLKTAPTEELAAITAGVATSCTGERSFGFGPFRDQLRSVEFMNYRGEVVTLSAKRPFGFLAQPLWEKYQLEYGPYLDFKNAPFPRFSTETDLMCGSEGQLGVVLKATFETTPLLPQGHLFFKLPRWTDQLDAHEEVFQKVQTWRGPITAVELLDYRSLAYLPADLGLPRESDLIVIEYQQEAFEQLYEEFITPLSFLKDEDVFEISESKYEDIRRLIPRHVAEYMSRHGVLKKGTDVQMLGESFEWLLREYLKASELGVDFLLFGHFGDGHLHFNFLPQEKQVADCEKYLAELYQKVRLKQGSPFAEHGIGLLKQDFIRPYFGKTQREAFAALKEQFDPHGQFFPQGFMA